MVVSLPSDDLLTQIVTTRSALHPPTETADERIKAMFNSNLHPRAGGGRFGPGAGRQGPKPKRPSQTVSRPASRLSALPPIRKPRAPVPRRDIPVGAPRESLHGVVAAGEVRAQTVQAGVLPKPTKVPGEALTPTSPTGKPEPKGEAGAEHNHEHTHGGMVAHAHQHGHAGEALDHAAGGPHQHRHGYSLSRSRGV